MQKTVHLLSIQPSQLYINAAKLAAVLKTYTKPQLTQEKFPVIQIQDKLTFTDQHTRALAAYLHGIDKICIYLDTDDISHEMYVECVNWCQEEAIYSVADLVGRVIDDDRYKELWIKRCRMMHLEVASRQNQVD